MSPEEICRRLGETKTKAIFHELTSENMKKVMREAKLPTTRLGTHTSTKKRNADWAAALWRAFVDKPLTGAAATLLFEWLTKTRRPMLAEFLSGLDVVHDGGLTDADFMQNTAPDKLRTMAEQLLGHHPPSEVAAYLLFLDATNKSDVFASLDLASKLAGDAVVPAAPTAAASP